MRHIHGCPYGPDCERSVEPTPWGGEETVCLTHDCDHPTQEEDTDDDH